MGKIEIELSLLETRVGSLQARLEYLRSSVDVKRNMPLRLAILEDEIAVTEAQIKRLKAYWSIR